jgi:hypothetical protein
MANDCKQDILDVLQKGQTHIGILTSKLKDNSWVQDDIDEALGELLEEKQVKRMGQTWTLIVQTEQ